MHSSRYTFLFLSALAAIVLVGGCTHVSSTRTAPPPGRQTEREDVPHHPGGDAGGFYSATRLTGDYAGYPRLTRFIDRMTREQGFSSEYLQGLFSQAKRKQWTLNYLAKEKPTLPPSPGAWTRYRSRFLDEQHIGAGVSFWGRHARTLQRAYEEYGVNPEHILGIMGVETIYGANLGNHRILDALTTLAFDYPRRADYFEEELESFLVMCRDEQQDPSIPKGSYAGAMGLGQFMPSSFLKFAVDFDGDGRKNLWDADDSIGSIANYFAGHGWKKDQSVVSPATVGEGGAAGLKTGFDATYSASDLAEYGIYPRGQTPLNQPLRLLKLRAQDGDQYWLGFDNFYVITRYNHSTHYAMAVHQLAEAIRRRYAGNRVGLAD